GAAPHDWGTTHAAAVPPPRNGTLRPSAAGLGRPCGSRHERSACALPGGPRSDGRITRQRESNRSNVPDPFPGRVAAEVVVLYYDLIPPSQATTCATIMVSALPHQYLLCGAGHSPCVRPDGSDRSALGRRSRFVSRSGGRRNAGQG